MVGKGREGKMCVCKGVVCVWGRAWMTTTILLFM